MTLEELKEEDIIIYNIAIKRAEEGILERYKDIYLKKKDKCNIGHAFDWAKTPEGNSIWNDVDDGEFKSFHNFHINTALPIINNIKEGDWVEYNNWTEGSRCKIKRIEGKRVHYSACYYSEDSEIEVINDYWDCNNTTELKKCKPPNETNEPHNLPNGVKPGDWVTCTSFEGKCKVSHHLTNKLYYTATEDSTRGYLVVDSHYYVDRTKEGYATITKCEPPKESPDYVDDLPKFDKTNKPIPTHTGFKKGTYVVLLKGASDDEYTLNYCYKILNNSSYLKTVVDNTGSANGWDKHPYNKSEGNDWRYATKDEAALYEKLGKPYDVTGPTTSKSKEESLLEEAKRRYPIGTKVKSAYSIHNNFKTITEGIVKGHNIVSPDDISSNDGLTLYYQGTWAEVIGTPLNQPKPNPSVPTSTTLREKYPKGTRFNCAKTQKTCVTDNPTNGDYCIVRQGDNYYELEGEGYLYYEGRYADIVSKPIIPAGSPIIYGTGGEPRDRDSFSKLWNDMEARRKQSAYRSIADQQGLEEEVRRQWTSHTNSDRITAMGLAAYASMIKPINPSDYNLTVDPFDKQSIELIPLEDEEDDLLDINISKIKTLKTNLLSEDSDDNQLY